MTVDSVLRSELVINEALVRVCHPGSKTSNEHPLLEIPKPASKILSNMKFAYFPNVYPCPELQSCQTDLKSFIKHPL